MAKNQDRGSLSITMEHAFMMKDTFLEALYRADGMLVIGFLIKEQNNYLIDHSDIESITVTYPNGMRHAIQPHSRIGAPREDNTASGYEMLAVGESPAVHWLHADFTRNFQDRPADAGEYKIDVVFKWGEELSAAASLNLDPGCQIPGFASKPAYNAKTRMLTWEPGQDAKTHVISIYKNNVEEIYNSVGHAAHSSLLIPSTVNLDTRAGDFFSVRLAACNSPTALPYNNDYYIRSGFLCIAKESWIYRLARAIGLRK